MAGLFGLFGAKPKYIDEIGTSDNQTEETETFFLDADEAKSLGNVEFMRQSKTITRTFPKTKNNPQGAKSVKDISSLSKGKINTDSQNNKPTTPKTDTNSEIKQRKVADTSMDMFRNIARQIKK